MTDGNAPRDPLGELSDAEFDALSPTEKGQRTREYNRRLEAGELDAPDDADAPDGDTEPDGDEPDAPDGDTEDEEAPTVRTSRTTWVTADASGKAIG